MLHKDYTAKEVDQFYKDFEAAGIRKPVSTMARLTGLSTGNVSEYLSRKKEASSKLISTFYEHYKPSTIVPRETLQSDIEIEGNKDKTIEYLAYSNKTLVESNAELVRMHREFLQNYISLEKLVSASSSLKAKGKVSGGPIEEMTSGKKETRPPYSRAKKNKALTASK